jgi:hypothetical protein
MPNDPMILLTVTTSFLAGLVIATAGCLRGWQGWLDLKRAELDVRREGAAPPPAVARIEIADLKERIRKLEAIAAGIDY